MAERARQCKAGRVRNAVRRADDAGQTARAVHAVPIGRTLSEPRGAIPGFQWGGRPCPPFF